MVKSQDFADLTQFYPISDLNLIGNLYEHYDKEEMKGLARHMTSANAIIFLLSSDFKNLPLIEESYQTSYNIEDIPEDLKKCLDCLSLTSEERSKISFPEANQFIPENFDLVNRLEEPQKLPICIETEQGDFLYYKLDGQFNLPYMHVNLFLNYKQEGGLLVRHYLNNKIWVNVFKEYFNSYFYQVEMGKIHSYFQGSLRGIEIEIDGFSDKIPFFIQTIAEKINSFKQTKSCARVEEIFQKQIKKFALKLDKLLKKPSYSQLIRIKSEVLLSDRFSIEEVRAHLKEMNFQEFS